MTKHHKSLHELNLLDDFLFGSMLNYPDIQEPFARILLETIFQKKFGVLKIVPQKTYYAVDPSKHGSRLDMYIEESTDLPDPDGTITYDLEVDHNQEDATALPKRTRFYHSIINVKGLESGTTYNALKRVIVLIIMDYDPFGKDRMCYTVRNQCVEEPDLPYDDGALTLFFYTKGTRGIPNTAIKQLLHYMQDTNMENAVNHELQQLQQMVNLVKQDPEVTLSYMKSWEHDEKIRRDSLAEGREEGREEGLAEGREENRKDQKRLILNMCKNGVPMETICACFEMSEEQIKREILLEDIPYK